jgi:hypothetical protein
MNSFKLGERECKDSDGLRHFQEIRFQSDEQSEELKNKIDDAHDTIKNKSIM